MSATAADPAAGRADLGLRRRLDCVCDHRDVAHSRRYPDPGTHANAYDYPNPGEYPDADRDANADRYSIGDVDADLDTPANKHIYPESDAAPDEYPSAHQHRDAAGQFDADADSSADPDTDHHQYTGAEPDSIANGYADDLGNSHRQPERHADARGGATRQSGLHAWYEFRVLQLVCADLEARYADG